MKQYKLTAWPELPARFQKTAMRRVVSELTQRFASVRDLSRLCGAPAREIEALVALLASQGQLMSRDAPQSIQGTLSWRDWWPVAALLGALRNRR